jgi:hypothetical protein
MTTNDDRPDPEKIDGGTKLVACFCLIALCVLFRAAFALAVIIWGPSK